MVTKLAAVFLRLAVFTAPSKKLAKECPVWVENPGSSV